MSKVLIIGDIIIDKYIYGTSKRISPEAPLPVISQQKIEEKLGGAGLVYENLKNLGVDVKLYQSGQPKSVKTRIICDGHYISRVDDDKIADGMAVLNDICSRDLSSFDYIILSDYNKGTLDYSRELLTYFKKFKCKVIVDPKRDAAYFDGAWIVKPNKKEFTELNFDRWTKNIIVTSANDPVTARLGKNNYKFDVDNVEVFDVTGAGDCFLAGFVYGLVNSYSFEESIKLAVNGSTESVKHLGTYILSEKDLKKKIVFTNGCFDILHKGHLTLLKEARELGDKLIVGLNSDSSVKKLKGKTRPYNNFDIRKEQLELIPYVDEVIEFNEDTPYNLIKQIKPDLIVKGGDYTVEEIVGHDLAPVHIVPTVKGHSTTEIIEKNYT